MEGRIARPGGTFRAAGAALFSRDFQLQTGPDSAQLRIIDSSL